VEITSPYAGLLKETLVQEGQVAKVGQGLCITEVDEEVSDSSDVLTSEFPDASPATGALMPKEERVTPGNQPGVSQSRIASEKRPVSSSSLASTRSE
jgi:2-oxoisovalerate dehydrogenase E2 component (dihydrolipoyl transacylase)